MFSTFEAPPASLSTTLCTFPTSSGEPVLGSGINRLWPFQSQCTGQLNFSCLEYSFFRVLFFLSTESAQEGLQVSVPPTRGGRALEPRNVERRKLLCPHREHYGKARRHKTSTATITTPFLKPPNAGNSTSALSLTRSQSALSNSNQYQDVSGGLSSPA